MMNFPELPSAPSDHTVPLTDQLRLAVAAYLARFKGTSREHTAADLRCYLAWCAERGLDPLAARRPHLELYIRWMQEFRAHLLFPLMSQKLSTFIVSENSADLMILRDLLESGKITPAIDRTYPLGQTPAAIRHVQEGRARGKVVITI